MPPKINSELCNGCRRCYETCPLDVLGFDEDRKVAVVLYPEECWHCGVCELECSEGAVDVTLPLKMRLLK